jgi:spore coat polysaccharide biosynthesis protein SpsF
MSDCSVGIFVQMRTRSARLPRKALLPLAGATVAHHVLRSLARVPADAHGVLCDEASREDLAAVADAEGFELFVGPPEDVLARFVMASTYFGVEQVIRATGDNPLVSGPLAEAILALHIERDADLSHFVGCPLGTGVEVIDAVALRDAHSRVLDPFEREHLTQHFYRNRERYVVIEEPCPPPSWFIDAKVSIDTEEDYVRMKRIFEDLYEGAPIETERLVQWLTQEMAVRP